MPDMASPTLENLPNESTGGQQPVPKNTVAKSTRDQAGRETESAPVHDWLVTTRGMVNGDAECFQEFYDAHFDLMFREASRLLGRDENTCLDIVQESLLKTMRAIRPIESAGQLQQWTRMVVRTTALDWLRKKQRRRESTSEAIGDLAVETDHDAHQNELARMMWIEEQLRATAPEIRQLLSLRYRLGWTLKEIASHLGIKTGAVDGRIRRAMDELKKQARANADEL